jgi:hypothetical protein
MHRHLLSRLAQWSGAAIVIGFGLALVATMGPTETAKDAWRTKVALADIPADGTFEVDWSFYRVLLVRTPELRAFGIPFQDGTYYLPDPNWDLAKVPCKSLVLRDNEFSCTDADLYAPARENYRWKKTGAPVSAVWLPPLKALPFRVTDTHLILGPE